MSTKSNSSDGLIINDEEAGGKNSLVEEDLSNGDPSVYLAQLFQDQCNLLTYAPGKFKYLQKILDREIANTSRRIAQEKYTPEAADKNSLKSNTAIPLSQVIMVPVDKYPNYNFVGRILGPRGMTVRQLEEQTGCKIMVRGRGSIKGKIRDRGSEDEPLHVLIQCEDYPERAKDKMNKAIAKVNELLTPPPDGKDELKRKQLVELAIINGTYRPTNATKVALQSPSPLDAGHLTTGVEFLTQRRTINTLPDGDFLQKFQLFQLLSCANNSTFAEYLLRSSLPTSMLSNSLNQAADYKNVHGISGGVHQATLQEYLDATALLNSIPSFVHDGSGDGPKK